ncbi:hypothetical protein F4777DRAFT_361065 [Nemania sp. FL0916]|nr:hypothetical protein F4777DRAFT_361065 [Nemania sp. FL0916]
MACRSCRRQLLQLARHGSTPVPITAELSSAVRGRQRLSRAATAPVANEQHRRGFRSTPNRFEQPRSGFMNSLKNMVGRASQPYRVMAATKEIYEACAKPANYKIDPIAIKAGTGRKTDEGEDIGEGSGMWHDDFKLLPGFSTWSQVTMLHMYLVFARLRNLNLEATRSWQAQLVDRFFFDAEERMELGHAIAARGLRSRYLKDLFVQWRGVVAAYDEGVAKGDAVLASAVWRNVFKAREDVDVRHLAAIVSWMRLCLKMLDQMPDEVLFTNAAAALKWPVKHEFLVVDKPVRMLEEQLAQYLPPPPPPPADKAASAKLATPAD